MALFQRWWTFVVPNLLLVIISSCATVSTPPLLETGDQVLFIGNSKIGSEGGLQHHFRRTIAKAQPPLEIETYWESMYDRTTLSEMYTDELIERITTGPDSIILVSDGTQEAMEKFKQLIQQHGKTMIIFATWADNPFLPGNSLDDFHLQTKDWIERAATFGKLRRIPVVPSGLIFYDLLIKPPSYPGLRPDFLFVPGSSVQNDLGTMVNVAAIYAVLTGRSPVGLPIWDPFPQELIQDIEERVWEIVQQWQQDKIKLRPVTDYRSPASLAVINMNSSPPLWSPLIRNGDSILYVGNSYIGTEGGLNNHFARMMGEVTPTMEIHTNSHIFWGQGLQRMYTDEVRADIADHKYDMVVVTSGPTELLQQFREDIQAAGSEMMVHMTWGRNPTINEEGIAGYRKQTIEIVETMRAFESSTGVPIAPCGLVFYDLIVDPPAVEGLRQDWVYMVENIHQNHLGTMVNAATHYAVMTGRSPVGLPMWDPYPKELVKAVQERAWKIVQDWKEGQIEIK
jgi:hypothetical protein